MALDLELSIGGCANNAPVELVARGGREDGRLHLEVEAARVAMHWDPVLGVLGALDFLLLAELADDVSVAAWARTVLHDDQGREVGSWALSGELARDGDRLAWRAQLMDCRVRFEVGERVVGVDEAGLRRRPNEVADGRLVDKRVGR